MIPIQGYQGGLEIHHQAETGGGVRRDANALPGPDVINLPAGTYTLTIGGTGEDAAATGDLDITSELTISGAGAGTTIVSSFLLGGFIMGLVAALPSYFISLRFFQFVRRWRQKRRDRKVLRKTRQ